MKKVKFARSGEVGFEAEYLCVSVTNSLDFTPGKTYSPGSVQTACDAKGWDVTIVKHR